LLKGEAQVDQTNLVAYLMSLNHNNVALVCLPMFTYKKGQLYMLENNALKMLSVRGLICDRAFKIDFKEHVDAREKRPLVFNGRLCNTGKEDNVWVKGRLWGEGRAEVADQLAARNMQIIEDLAPDALPTSTDTSIVTVQGAAKFAQLGEDAITKLMQALVQDAGLDARSAVIWVDAFPVVGHTVEDFYLQKTKCFEYQVRQAMVVVGDCLLRAAPTI
jgi:hypothetical protein